MLLKFVLTCLMVSTSLYAQQQPSPPKVLAIMFTADWCGNCKIVKPRVEEVKAKFQDQSVLFIDFDLTDDIRKSRTALLASSLGVGHIYAENQRTGFLLVIDAKTKKIVERVTKEHTPTDIKQAILNALQDNGPSLKKIAGNIYNISGATDEIGVSVGNDGLLVVDGAYMETFPMVDSVLKTLAPTAPKFLINTHWHHAFANPAFGKNTTIIAHEKVRQRLQQPNFMFNRTVPAQPSVGWPVLTFEDSLTIYFNGERITLTYLPNAHTDGDIVVIFHGSNVAMTGDVFVPHAGWIDYPSGGNFFKALDAVDKLLAIVPQSAKIIPGHGRTCTYNDIVEFKALLMDNLAHVRSQIANGKTLDEIKSAGMVKKWKSWVGEVPEWLFLESIYKSFVQ